MGIYPLTGKLPYTMLIPCRSPSTETEALNTILTHVKATGCESNVSECFTPPGVMSKKIVCYFVSRVNRQVHSVSKCNVLLGFRVRNSSTIRMQQKKKMLNENKHLNHETSVDIASKSVVSHGHMLQMIV